MPRTTGLKTYGSETTHSRRLSCESYKNRCMSGASKAWPYQIVARPEGPVVAERRRLDLVQPVTIGAMHARAVFILIRHKEVGNAFVGTTLYIVINKGTMSYQWPNLWNWRHLAVVESSTLGFESKSPERLLILEIARPVSSSITALHYI